MAALTEAEFKCSNTCEETRDPHLSLFNATVVPESFWSQHKPVVSNKIALPAGKRESRGEATAMRLEMVGDLDDGHDPLSRLRGQCGSLQS
jgi:hypothetical protein